VEAKVIISTEYFCANCGKKLLPDEHPCSQCGKEERNIKQYLEDTVPACDDTRFRATLKTPGIPGNAYEVTQKKKISGETKKPTNETMIIDRTHPEKTIKKHIVDEQDGEKSIRCHNELEENKAKHRKKSVTKKLSKWIKGNVPGLIIGFILGIIASLVVAVWIAPFIFEWQESNRQKGLEFSIDLQSIVLDVNDIVFRYNFTGVNYNSELWTKDVTLKILFYENDTLSVTNYFNNPQNVIPEIKGNMISFVWDIIPKKVNNTPGEINLYFEVDRHSLLPNPTLSTDRLPVTVVEIQDIGEYNIDKKGIYLKWS